MYYVSQFMQSPSVVRFMVVKRILQYLYGTKNLGIFSRPSNLSLTAFCDADWIGDTSDCRSTISFVALLCSTPISWSRKKQQIVVSWSSTKAKYPSLTTTTADLHWLHQLFYDLHVYLLETPVMWCDNIDTISLASDPVFHA